MSRVFPCASVEVSEEYLLTPLRTLVVRVACWMTASVSYVRVEDCMERVWRGCDFGEFWIGFGGVKFA